MIVVTTIVNGEVLEQNVPLRGRASLELQHQMATDPDSPYKGMSVRVIERCIPDKPIIKHWKEDDDTETMWGRS